MGHSCRTLLWGTLVWTLLWGTLVWTLLWGTLVGDSCGTLLWGTLVGHYCLAASRVRLQRLGDSTGQSRRRRRWRPPNQIRGGAVFRSDASNFNVTQPQTRASS